MSAANKLQTDATGPAVLVLAALAVWDINDASGPYSVPDATLFLTIVSVILGIALLKGNETWGSVPKVPLFLSCACLLFGVIMTPFRLDFYQQYVLADAGTMALFVLCLLVSSKYYEKLFNIRTVYWFAIVYSLIAVFAYISAVVNLRPSYWWHGRWDPPYFMLFGALSLLLRYKRDTGFTTFLYIALIVVMSGFALYSGNRTQFALGALFMVLAWISDIRVMFLVFVGVLISLLLYALGFFEFDIISSVFEDTRFGLLDGGADESLLGRFREASDIWYHFTTLNSPAQSFFGRGFGATWQQVSSFARENVIDGGRTVHYLHIGFVNLGFRYGIFGAVLFLYWAWIVVANAKVMFSAKYALEHRFWYLGGLGFSVNFFFQNSLYDPPAVMAMAALLVMNHRMRISSREKPAELSPTHSSHQSISPA
ncbi:hypothetical protein [Devosia sp. XK-2]|uniref:O-antigen ligase family protein n=1 Tax=Devosia sp. XK-2 TaxID=3126689 RepID=UPI0030D0B55D